jgi:hypothetical protein
MSDLSLKRQEYLPVFKLLISDFQRICQFIEPTDDNLKTYSHRIYELFLRSCTEFESIAKDSLASVSYSKTKNLNINDYVHLESYLGLERFEVGMLLWRPNRRFTKPFDKWTTNSPKLIWYQNYNQVKHNRNNDFQKSNLENLVLAISGLFVLMAQTSLLPAESPPKFVSEENIVRIYETYTDCFFGDIPMVLRSAN